MYPHRSQLEPVDLVGLRSMKWAIEEDGRDDLCEFHNYSITNLVRRNLLLAVTY